MHVLVSITLKANIECSCFGPITTLAVQTIQIFLLTSSSSFVPEMSGDFIIEADMMIPICNKSVLFMERSKP